MSKKKNYMKRHRYSKGVQLEMDDVDYWNDLDDTTPTVKLPNGDLVTERAYMKQFMYENYGNGFYQIEKEKRILQEDDQLKDARRNNNRTNRDALVVALKRRNHIKVQDPTNGEYKTGTICHDRLAQTDTSRKTVEEKWQTCYKMEGDEAKSLELLMESHLNELGLDYTTRRGTILLRMYFNVKKLVALMRKDRRNGK